MKILYIIYQICIGLPIFLVLTILTALTTMIGCWLGNGHFCVKKYCNFVKKHLTQNINQHIIARYDIRRNSMHQSPGVC